MPALVCGISTGIMTAAPEKAVFGELPSLDASRPGGVIKPAQLISEKAEISLTAEKSLPVAREALPVLQEKLDSQKDLYGAAPKIMYDLPKKLGEITDLTNPRLPELDKLRKDLETKFAPRFVPLLANLKAEVEVLDQRSREMLVNRDSNAGDGIAEGFRNLQRKILELYREIPLEAINERTYLASNFAIAKDGEKAWYGRDDNYRPEVYEIIHKATRSSVGIFPRNGHNSGKPRGSGVVIGRNLVLTANHVVDDAEDIEASFDVVFNYEEVRDPAAKTMITIPSSRHEITKVVYSADRENGAIDDKTGRADFAILEFNPINIGGNPLPAEPGKEIGLPIPLYASTYQRDTPIFLVGHPLSSPRMVHDNSWVKFPYLVSEREWKDLLCQVNAEFVGVGGGAAAEQADKFLRSYRKTEIGGGRFKYRYVARRDSVDVDAIGVESDTFKGDSGAPAMLRDTGEIIGILTRGEPDQEIVKAEERLRTKSGAYLSGWKHHEILLPSTVIIELMTRSHPTWITDYGVKVIK